MECGWNHNTHYHPLLLRSVPGPCPRALDVGCGLGTFARKLARVAGEVDAIDVEPQVVRRAEDATAAKNVRYAACDFLEWRAPGYDLIAMVASIHHMPFEKTLTHAVGLLNPGGVLAVLGLHRSRSLADVLWSAVATPVSWAHRLTRPTAAVDAPLTEPTMSLGEVHRRATKLFPGAEIRRLLLWRYILVFRPLDYSLSFRNRPLR